MRNYEPNPIDTKELCSYGCGQTALFINKSGNLMCANRCNKCPYLRKKNSNGLKNAYETGILDASKIYKNKSQEAKDRQASNRGKNFAIFGTPGSGGHKVALIRERGHQCEQCKNTEWLNKPITLELEHTDGIKTNNTRENLRLLCPNCHSYTPTWRRKKSSLKLPG